MSFAETLLTCVVVSQVGEEEEAERSGEDVSMSVDARLPRWLRRSRRGSPASNSGQPCVQFGAASGTARLPWQPRAASGAALRSRRGSPASKSGLPRAAIGAVLRAAPTPGSELPRGQPRPNSGQPCVEIGAAPPEAPQPRHSVGNLQIPKIAFPLGVLRQILLRASPHTPSRGARAASGSPRAAGSPGRLIRTSYEVYETPFPSLRDALWASGF